MISKSIFQSCFSLMLSILIVGCGGGDEGGTKSSSSDSDDDILASNLAPTVRISETQYVEAGTQVFLTAKASDDVAVVSMSWSQSEGTDVELTTEDDASISFEAPRLDSGETLSFLFTAVDADEQATTAVAYVVVNPYSADEQSVSYEIKLPDIVAGLEDDSNLLLATGSKLISVVLSEPVSLAVDLEDDEAVVVLASEDGEPILMNFTASGSTEVELSVETSADAFVLRSPRFFGLKVTDSETLLSRIHIHEDYSSLVAAIEDALEYSLCPMDQACNPTAARISESIAQDIENL